ncbi:protein FAM220A [Callospermophilus lateralis]|uniref:protein FAM220A n=1 Tax=Callospermophilus lateralis TaxID=76772 RepID=UPI0040386D3A
MRDGGGNLSICLIEAKGEGGDDWYKQLCSLKKRTQKESPCPADIPFWMDKSAVDVNGNSQNEVLSLEMKNDLSDTDLLLHNGNKELPYLKKSMGRNLAPVAAPTKAMGLSFAPAEEHLAGVFLGVGDALGRDWLRSRPRAMDSQRGQCPKGEPWVSGQPVHPKLWEMVVFKGEPPSALHEGLGSESELSRLRSVLPATLHSCPEVLLEDKTRCVFLDHLKPMFSEQTTEYKKMLSCVKSTSNGLEITLGLLALQPFQLANPLCHS